jgi:hypothetical protein
MGDIINGRQGDQEDGINIGDGVLFMDKLTQKANAHMKRQSKRTRAYTHLEDKMIVRHVLQ